jgi:hypothetical protein
MQTSKLSFAALTCLAFSLFAATELKADGTYNYVYESGGNTFTWQLSANPVITPDNVSLGEYFTIPDFSFSENGVATSAYLDFYNTSLGGGFDLWDGSIFLSYAFGPQLYTGPETAPTMLTGTFSLTDYGNFDFASPASQSTLQVTAVPEPSTLSLLGIGVAMGLMGFLFRKS